MHPHGLEITRTLFITSIITIVAHFDLAGATQNRDNVEYRATWRLFRSSQVSVLCDFGFGVFFFVYGCDIHFFIGGRPGIASVEHGALFSSSLVFAARCWIHFGVHSITQFCFSHIESSSLAAIMRHSNNRQVLIKKMQTNKRTKVEKH
jgi:hypothetical protein